MKRDPDVCRDILLAFEANDDFLSHQGHISHLDIDSIEALNYLRMLEDAGWLARESGKSGATHGWRITWQGYEFIEKTRDPQIWSQAKTAARSLGGSALGLLGELASGYLKAKAQSLGIPML